MRGEAEDAAVAAAAATATACGDAVICSSRLIFKLILAFDEFNSGLSPIMFG